MLSPLLLLGNNQNIAISSKPVSTAKSLAKNACQKLSHSPIIDKFLVKPKIEISREHLSTLQCIDCLNPDFLWCTLHCTRWMVYICLRSCLLADKLRDLSQAEKKTKLMSNLNKYTNDNYFHSKWSKVVISSENSCHFLNLLSFA